MQWAKHLSLEEYHGSIPQKQKEILCRALRFIDCEFGRALTLSDIARQSGTNRTYLAQIFRSVLGASVHQILTNVRMLAASRWLIETDMTITQISWEAGYRNNSSFSRAFSIVFGMCPRTYRRTGLSI
ncbi:helix-turn-helix transcriptional regulator [Novosphingobium taihuense]